MLVGPLPYPDPGAIVRVGETDREHPQSGAVLLTNTTLPPLDAEAESFEQLAAYRPRSFDWDGPDGRTALSGAWVSPSVFPLLRARPQLGRLFTEADARAGAEQVALLSHGAWTRRFGSRRDVVGTVIALDDTPHTVVGVLAEDFYFPRPAAEVWTPWVMPSIMLPGPGGQPPAVVLAFSALGRLRPGVSPERAETEVRTILQRIDNDFLRRIRRGDDDAPGAPPVVDARVIPLQEVMVGEYRPALLALTAAVALVLLIACSNVAGLLLARGVTRGRELGPPRGAGRGPGPGRAPAPDRERGAGSGRRFGRAGRGRRGAPRGAGAGPGVCRAAPRSGSRRRRARVYPRAVGPRRAGVRGSAGVPVVEERPGGHAQRRQPAGYRRLSAAALEPDAGRAGGRPGHTRDRAAGRRGAAPAHLRGARHDRPRLQPGRRHRRPHPQSRSGGPEPPLHRGVAGGSGGDGAPSRRGRGRPVVGPAARVQPHGDGDARRRPAGTERPQRVAAVVDSRGQPGLLRRDADAPP